LLGKFALIHNVDLTHFFEKPRSNIKESLISEISTILPRCEQDKLEAILTLIK